METTVEGSAVSILHLNVGLQNGCLIRITLDQVTGDLSDNRTRYLGTRPVKVFRVRIQGKEAVRTNTHFLITSFFSSCLLVRVAHGYSTTIKAVSI
jgi:hypothetical protein